MRNNPGIIQAYLAFQIDKIMSNPFLSAILYLLSLKFNKH